MTREGHAADQGWSGAVRQKLQELAELVSQERFGEAGIPKEITFSEIEEIGHQVPRRVSLDSRFDEELGIDSLARIAAASVRAASAGTSSRSAYRMSTLSAP